jgi:hypothetical protein
MPKIGNEKPYVDKPCDRCGNKRKISKKWIEKVENTYGFMTLYHTQVLCTDKECQVEFEDVQRVEQEKRDIRIAKSKQRKDIKISKTA